MLSALNRVLYGEPPAADALAGLIENMDDEAREVLYHAAAARRNAVFGRRVYFRGLIEFTNYCRCDCMYCGLRRSNKNVTRYRLDKGTILACCRIGHELGYRSFVLQGGEDPFFDDDALADIVGAIHETYRDSAVTLSIGERSRDSYRRLYDEGADRCLVRHETADAAHYARLHPDGSTLGERLECLRVLKEIGYQVGAGFMVGSPWQTPDTLAKDLLLLHDFQPHMIGIGPFIPHHDTPLARFSAGSVGATLDMIAMTRLLVPRAMMPATTALASVAADGRERALAVGANVVMPNLSPPDVRSLYDIYDNKKSAGSEAAESLAAIQEQIRRAGFEPDMSRGDWD